MAEFRRSGSCEPWQRVRHVLALTEDWHFTAGQGIAPNQYPNPNPAAQAYRDWYESLLADPPAGCGASSAHRLQRQFQAIGGGQ